MEKYILSLDAGTTSSRALILDAMGRIVSQAQYEFRQYYPNPGWVEHDGEEIWNTQWKAIQEAMQKIKIKPDSIEGIGITNQRETVVLWDRNTGKPVAPAIVWQDRRTSQRCDELKEQGKADFFQKKTGLVLDAYFSGTKLEWLLREHQLLGYAKKGNLAFGTIDSWLVWNLTAGKYHITDVTNASRTLLFNIHDLSWDKELLDCLSIPKQVLPEVTSSSGTLALTDSGVFGDSIPVAGIAGDQQAALFGQLCLQPGMVKNTYGTGCFVVMNTGTESVESKNGLLSTIAWQINNETTYALEGSIFIAGALVQWLRDELKIINSASEIETLAASVDDNGGVTVIPALAGLATPYWDQYARGAILGLTRGSGRAHIARASLEALALRTFDVIEVMEKESGIQMKELRVDGGASRNNLLMQIQAELLESEIVRPAETETTALGAAFLAGLGCGMWKSVDELKDLWKEDYRFGPKGKLDKEGLIRNWKLGIKAVSGWAREEMV